jgi:hypothetical protein
VCLWNIFIYSVVFALGIEVRVKKIVHCHGRDNILCLMYWIPFTVYWLFAYLKKCCNFTFINKDFPFILFYIRFVESKYFYIQKSSYFLKLIMNILLIRIVLNCAF